MNKWIYSISWGNEVMCFMTVEMEGIIDMGNAYNVVMRSGELFMEKDRCSVSADKIEYRSNGFYICLDRDYILPRVD